MSGDRIFARFSYVLCVLTDRLGCMLFHFFFFKQKTAYEMRISDWSSDVCSSDLGSLSTMTASVCRSRVSSLMCMRSDQCLGFVVHRAGNFGRLDRKSVV